MFGVSKEACAVEVFSKNDKICTIFNVFRDLLVLNMIKIFWTLIPFNIQAKLQIFKPTIA